MLRVESLSLFLFAFLLSSSLCFADSSQHDLSAVAFKPIASDFAQRIDIIDAVQVLGRYLASTKIGPRNEDEGKSWAIEHKGASKMFAPAWFTSDWKMISVGEPIYAADFSFTAIPSGVDPSESALQPRSRFPAVVSRDPMAESCPFIYLIPTRIMCLDNELRIERSSKGNIRQVELPFQASGAFVESGQVWIKGLHEGKLLHSFDWEKLKIDQDLLSVSSVVQALTKAGFGHTDLISYTEDQPSEGREAADRQTGESDPTEISKSENGSEFDEYYTSLQSTAGSFQFDIVLSDNNIFLILRRPLVLLVGAWPSCKISGTIKVEKDDLPSFAHEFGEVFLNSSGYWQGKMLVWLSLARPMTFASYRQSNPAAAQAYIDHSSVPTPDDTFMGVEERNFALAFDKKRFLGSYEIRYQDDEWVPVYSSIFLSDNKHLWIAARNRKSRLPGLALIN